MMRAFTRNKIRCPECGAPFINPEFTTLGLGFVEMVLLTTMVAKPLKRHTAESMSLTPGSMSVYISRMRTALRQIGSKWEIVAVGVGRGNSAEYYAKLSSSVRDQDTKHQKDVPDGRRVNPVRS